MDYDQWLWSRAEDFTFGGSDECDGCCGSCDDTDCPENPNYEVE